jgi:hypothetical protein
VLAEMPRVIPARGAAWLDVNGGRLDYEGAGLRSAVVLGYAVRGESRPEPALWHAMRPINGRQMGNVG